MNPEITLALKTQASASLAKEKLNFNELLERHQVTTLLNDMILEYHKNHAGSPRVYQVEIKHPQTTFQADRLAGSFTTSYHIEFYFPCDAMSEYIQAELSWTVSIDNMKSTLKIKGPIIWDIDN
ncbi:hypothetical protein [Pedobacter antarcticus]|uniref:hypothetical protein n=1 Tax=Pedobacter antarcticus TaxID=34086 RepID=UPI00292D3999|nr:hypothetical protein [Pedobacter antarcticus]